MVPIVTPAKTRAVACGCASPGTSLVTVDRATVKYAARASPLTIRRASSTGHGESTPMVCTSANSTRIPVSTARAP